MCTQGRNTVQDYFKMSATTVKPKKKRSEQPISSGCYCETAEVASQCFCRSRIVALVPSR